LGILLRYRLADEAYCEYGDHATFQTAVEGQYAMLLTESARVEDYPMRDLSMQLVAGGRLVRISRPDRSVAILVTDDDSVAGIPIYAAEIDKTWIIVR